MMFSVESATVQHGVRPATSVQDLVPGRLLEAADNHGSPAVIDLAMTIEYTAYDLYRTMAERTDNADARVTFLAIAQAEKAHLRVLTRVTGQISHEYE